jgi:hypothetical protein
MVGMKKILTTIAIMISIPSLLLSQTTFERTYGGHITMQAAVFFRPRMVDI